MLDGFRPHPLTVGPHRQTLLGFWARRRLRWPHPFEERVVEAGGEVRLVVRVTWQERRAERPTLLIVHGLGGSSEGSYGISLGRLALARGFNVARMNMRGAGDSERLCPLLYHAGLDADVVAVLRDLATLTPRVATVGFSLGGNQVALAASRCGTALPHGAYAFAAVSPPLDLSACTEALARPSNRFYERYYLDKLKADYARRQRLRPDLFAAGAEAGLRTIREYDERITAPHGGFAGADDYYARSSSGPWLAAARRPLLLLGALDDPMIPAESVTRWPLPEGGCVVRELHPTGGHVGFYARAQAPGRFWAADRVLRFFELQSP